MEKRPCPCARSQPSGRPSRRPRSSRPKALAGSMAAASARKSGSSTTGSISPCTTRHQSLASRNLRKIAAHRVPERFGLGADDFQRSEPIADGFVWQSVQGARRKRAQFRLVETRGAMRQARQIEGLREFVERSDRPHGVGRADQHRKRRGGERLDAALAQARRSTGRPFAWRALRRWRRSGDYDARRSAPCPPAPRNSWICTAVLVT